MSIKLKSYINVSDNLKASEDISRHVPITLSVDDDLRASESQSMFIGKYFLSGQNLAVSVF